MTIASIAFLPYSSAQSPHSTPKSYGFDFFEKYASSESLRDTVITSRRIGYTEDKRCCMPTSYYCVCVGDIGSLANKPLLRGGQYNDLSRKLMDTVEERCKSLAHLVDYVEKISHKATIMYLANHKGELLALKWEYANNGQNAPSFEQCARLADTLVSLNILPTWGSIDKEAANIDDLWAHMLPIYKRTTKEEYLQMYNDNLAILKQDHTFNSFIEGATDSVALTRLIEFIDNTVQLTATEKKQLRAALWQVLQQPKPEYGDRIRAWRASIQGVALPVALQGRLANSAIDSALPEAKQAKFYDAYLSYFKKMRDAINDLETGFYFGILYANEQVVIRAYNKDYLNEIKEHLSGR